MTSHFLFGSSLNINYIKSNFLPKINFTFSSIPKLKLDFQILDIGWNFSLKKFRIKLKIRKILTDIGYLNAKDLGKELESLGIGEVILPEN